MKVLVANIPLRANRFLQDLNGAMGALCELEHSSDRFWSMEGEADVVHLHFPEYLTYELQTAYLEGLTEALVDEVRTRLEYWSERARIVVTRHVLLPHDARSDPIWERMYEMVYSFADGVVHFGRASIDEFATRYAATRFQRGTPPEHVVIPHQNYTSLPDTISRAEAREKLGLAGDADVMLVFGAIRSDEERQLVLDTFRALGSGKHRLLVSRWRENLADVAWIRLKYWLRDLTRLYYRLHPSFHFNYAFVPEADSQLYLNAADVLFIPRTRVLNSGNIALGFTFGKVVVGPDSWDVGEILRESSNPVFDPDRPETAGAAVERGFTLAREGRIGAANRERAVTEWAPDRCAARYIDFFNRLVLNFQSELRRA